MWLRYLSAFLAFLFGLLLSFVIVDQGIYWGFKFDWRTLLAVVALICSTAVFFRQSVLFVIFAMGLQLATYFQSTVEIVGGVLTGAWVYSRADFVVLPLEILPVLSLVVALFALINDALGSKGGRKLFRSLRSWPYEGGS